MNSTNKSPKFSILTPTLDRPEELNECCESVLNQTFQDWEQIVYNVGAPTRVPDDPRVRYHTGTRAGPAADFQAALELAHGQIIHPLSDDDRLPSHALQTVNDRIGDHRWLCGGTAINKDGRPWAIRGGRRSYLTDTREGRYMLGGAIYWRKELSDEVGGFDPELDGAADFDLYLRFLEVEEPALVEQILYLYRDHAGTNSRTQPARQADASARAAARSRDRAATRTT